MLTPVSRTFHGRDVFSPTAAHLAGGVALDELGPPVEPAALVRLELPVAQIGKTRIRATVLYVDRFGNIQLNLTAEHVRDAGIEPGAAVEVALGDEWSYAVAARTFADARPGDIILYEDAYRNFALAISGGNAAAMFGAAPGGSITIVPRVSS